MSEKKSEKKSGGLSSWFIGDYSGKNDSGGSPEKPSTQEDCVVDLHQRIADLDKNVIFRLKELDFKVCKSIEANKDCIIDLHQRITDLENNSIPRLKELDLKVSKLIEANKNLITYFSSCNTQRHGSK